jgi:hypothetical protein
MTSDPNDHPFHEVVKSALKKMNMGFTVRQKWTCDHCNFRQEMKEANKFYSLGVCQFCEKFTDIQKRGCNYSAEIFVPKIKH